MSLNPDFLIFIREYLSNLGLNAEDFLAKVRAINFDEADVNQPQDRLGYFYALKRDDFVRLCATYAMRFASNRDEVQVLIKRIDDQDDCDFLEKLEIALEYKELMDPLLRWKMGE